jgi:hypothetical protein
MYREVVGDLPCDFVLDYLRAPCYEKLQKKNVLRLTHVNRTIRLSLLTGRKDLFGCRDFCDQHRKSRPPCGLRISQIQVSSDDDVPDDLLLRWLQGTSQCVSSST